MDTANLGLRLLPIAAVVEKAGISRPYVWKLVGQDAFPRPLHLGKRARAWRSDEIDAWIEARTAERDRRTNGQAGVSVHARQVPDATHGGAPGGLRPLEDDGR